MRSLLVVVLVLVACALVPGRLGVAASASDLGGLTKPRLAGLESEYVDAHYADDDEAGTDTQMIEEANQVGRREEHEPRRTALKSTAGFLLLYSSRFVFGRSSCLPPPLSVPLWVAGCPQVHAPRMLKSSQFREYFTNLAASKEAITTFVETSTRSSAADKIAKCKLNLNSWLSRCVF